MMPTAHVINNIHKGATRICIVILGRSFSSKNNHFISCTCFAWRSFFLDQHDNSRNGSKSKHVLCELPTTLKGRGFPFQPRSPKYPIKDARSYTKSTGFTFGRSARSLFPFRGVLIASPLGFRGDTT